MRTRRSAMFVATGIIALVGCGDSNDRTSIDSSAVPSVAPGTSPISTPATAARTSTSAGPEAEILFHDPLDDDTNAWGIVDDPQFGSATFADGDYVWNFSGSVAHWLPGVLGEQYDRGELEFRDVVVHAELSIISGDGVAGVFCREQPDTDADWQWYEFVVRNGFAAIRLADLEGNIDVLAETQHVSLPTGAPIAMDATCIDGTDGKAHLSLALNGSPLLEVSAENPLGNGVAGMQAWTFPVHEQMDLRWHEFSVSRAAA